LLAHFSEDPKLVKAYIDGEDIHARTAAEIFKIDIAAVSSDDRRKAKAVNFGIIYGISSFGLSESTNISRKAAQEYIDRYFETYPRVREYMDGNVLKAKETGKIRTITGRLRNIPEIHSSNFNVRSFGERASMNMPLQGSSADIIKIAMNGVFRELRQMNLKSKLILQIHDELVIDTVISEAELVKEIVREQMEGAVALRVPLIADISYGKDLYEAK
jgi:DNA polymerase-1